jgi:GNAT superfamily N-acetyltransferase
LSEHPLAVALNDAAHGRYPPVDGRVDVVPSPGPPCDALVAFTGHYVLAADVGADEIAARWPVGALSLPFAPASLEWLAARLGRRPLTHDLLLVAFADGAGAPEWLRRDDGFAHPRVDEAARHRTVDEVWTDDRGSVVTIGRGLCGRWEVGYEVAAEHRNDGLGRRLVAAARGLVPAGEPLWAQVAPGNAASVRSTLAAGFVPVGAEVLFAARRRSGGPDG